MKIFHAIYTTIYKAVLITIYFVVKWFGFTYFVLYTATIINHSLQFKHDNGIEHKYPFFEQYGHKIFVFIKLINYWIDKFCKPADDDLINNISFNWYNWSFNNIEYLSLN